MDEVALGKDLVAAPTVELTHALAEHVVKHLDAATKTILQNNIALAKHTEGAPGSIGMAADGLDCYRDQGYTRAKVLVLAPFRHVAYVFMKEMLRACGGTSTGDSWKRFETEFGPGKLHLFCTVQTRLLIISLSIIQEPPFHSKITMHKIITKSR